MIYLHFEIQATTKLLLHPMLNDIAPPEKLMDEANGFAEKLAERPPLQYIGC